MAGNFYGYSPIVPDYSFIGRAGEQASNAVLNVNDAIKQKKANDVLAGDFNKLTQVSDMFINELSMDAEKTFGDPIKATAWAKRYGQIFSSDSKDVGGALNRLYANEKTARAELDKINTDKQFANMAADEQARVNPLGAINMNNVQPQQAQQGSGPVEDQPVAGMPNMVAGRRGIEDITTGETTPWGASSQVNLQQGTARPFGSQTDMQLPESKLPEETPDQVMEKQISGELSQLAEQVKRGITSGADAYKQYNALKKEYNKIQEEKKKEEQKRKDDEIKAQADFKRQQLLQEQEDKAQMDRLNREIGAGKYAKNSTSTEGEGLTPKEQEVAFKTARQMAIDFKNATLPSQINLFKTLDGYIDIYGKGKIPGIGAVKSLVPIGVLGAVEKDAETSQKAKEIRSALAQIRNITLKDRSGAAVTVPEFERFKEEIGMFKFANENDLRASLQRGVEILRRYAQSFESPYSNDIGYKPAVAAFEAYKTKGGLTSENLPQPKGSTEATPQMLPSDFNVNNQNNSVSNARPSLDSFMR